jgi:hypothetical protein
MGGDKQGRHMEMNGNYSKPVLVTLGTAEELTKSVNVLGGGDQQYSLLDS